MSQENQQQFRVNFNTEKMQTNYANAFQTNATAEEVLISFGINHPIPAQDNTKPAELIVEFSNRIVMNPFTAKRLAMSLLQTIQEHEERFGLIEIDPAKRVQSMNQ